MVDQQRVPTTYRECMEQLQILKREVKALDSTIRELKEDIDNLVMRLEPDD